MEDCLPKGLVTTSGKIPSELERLDGVDVSDIALLWRVYNTNPSVHDRYVGYRLENLFWRIWGSKRIQQNLRGSTVARLFLDISEPNHFPGSLIRREPAQVVNNNENDTPSSPLAAAAASRPLQPPQKNPLLLSPEKKSKLLLVQDQPRNKPRGAAPLPPILKKSNNASQVELNKTTRLLLTGPGGQSITRKPSNPPTPAGPSTTGDLVNRQGQKKTYFVAGRAANSRRRPAIMRRKSSQPSSTAGTGAGAAHRSPRIPPVSPVSPSGPTSKPDSGRRDEKEFSLPQPHLFGDPTILSPESLSSGESKQISSATLSARRVLMDTEDRPVSPKSTPPPTKSGFSTNSAYHHGTTARDSSSTEEQRQQSYQKQLSSMSLVDKDFRSRFAEKRLHAQRVSMDVSSLQAEASPERPPESITGRATDFDSSQHPSPSKLEESDRSVPGQNATFSLPSLSTCPTLVPPEPSHDMDRSASEDHISPSSLGNLHIGHLHPQASPLNSPPVSLPRPRSQLSLLIEQSRCRQPTTGSCSVESDESAVKPVARDSAGR